MATEAAKYNMEIGLKNALDIVDALAPTVSFAVNEQCAQLSECDRYASFLAAGKPVLHIEYPPLNAAAPNGTSCTGQGTAGMSTILKNLALDGPTMYCDGSTMNTPTVGGTSPPRPTKTLTPRPTTTRPTTTRSTTTKQTTTRQTTTRQTTASPTTRPTTVRTTSTRPPPTSTPGGGGCKSKHWDQCGGYDWKGCTVCEVSFLLLLSVDRPLILRLCSRRIRARESHHRITISVCRSFLLVRIYPSWTLCNKVRS